jgi:hypothetical protein
VQEKKVDFLSSARSKGECNKSNAAEHPEWRWMEAEDSRHRFYY